MFPLVSASGTPRQAGGLRSPRADDAAILAVRAPGLKDGADLILVSLVKSLQTMAGSMTTVEGAIAGFKMTTMRDLVASYRPGAISCTIDCAGLPCTLLTSLDAALVHTLVELLCGGTGAECLPDEMRPATGIDTQYAQIVMGLVSGAVAAEWASQGFGSTKSHKIEGKPAIDSLGAKVQEVVVVSVAVSLFGIRGLLTLVLPPVAVEAFAQPEATDAAAVAKIDPDWSSCMKREVGQAEIRVDVVLAAKPLSLRAIAQLEVGQMLVLPANARNQASLVCDGRTLYRGEIGQHDNSYSLRVNEVIAAQATIPSPGGPSGTSPFKTMLKA